MADNRLVNASIILVGLVVIVLILKTLQSFVRPLAVAIILTFIFMPTLRRLKAKRVPFIVGFLGILIVFALVVGLIVVLVLNNIASLDLSTYGVPAGLSAITGSLADFIEPSKVSQMAGTTISAVVEGVIVFISELFLVLIFLIFLIPSYTGIMGNIQQGMGKKGKRFNTALAHIETSIKDYLKTKTIISLGTAIVSGIVLMFFNSDLVLVFGILFFVLNFIPNLGSFIAFFIESVFLSAYNITFEFIFLAALPII